MMSMVNPTTPFEFGKMQKMDLIRWQLVMSQSMQKLENAPGNKKIAKQCLQHHLAFDSIPGTTQYYYIKGMENC